MLASTLNAHTHNLKWEKNLNWEAKLRGVFKLHSNVSFLLKDLCVYPFFLGVITCSKEFVLFCLKVREKGKKKKARYGMTRATQETLELARSYYKTLELILPKITPETAGMQSGTKILVDSYKPDREPEHTEVQHSQMTPEFSVNVSQNVS